uniref:NADH-ubiquinone oxidoreductase chain 4L n=1 Tax=Euciroa cf. queenslandica STW-2017 TaxID=1969321 RepID=A0A1U9XPE7_9BIVA|nr:NADH dehydrogenase subunit 4L [Euciroa cf. queenslandica STW-2017]AQZ26129.1 NADH dehydrogenase subunit 4L [Euciroa cf. queenslandica STW-2017]
MLTFMSSYIVLFCVITLSLQTSHFLNLLLILEMAVIGLYTSLVLLGALCFSYLCLIFIVMSVGEAVVGLALLVASVRQFGNDYVKSFVSAKF